ncbi:LamG domain-containing protein [Halapricum sp. CBA1109]|uniref:LamG domain-containing protein n=1 Tax=Halapricum sp. CBA1109 TaxID=2668068 RepID=UPI0018D206BA|nr:LamG domain-containing protein [Halapricum sp. CBA1109]
MGEPPPAERRARTDDSVSRRDVLKTTGVGLTAAAGLAGCLGGDTATGGMRLGYGGVPMEVQTGLPVGYFGATSTATLGTSSGLVGYWPLDGTGSVATDAVGGNDAAIRGTPQQGVPGVFDSGAYDFAGGDADYLAVADAGALRPPKISVGGWFRTDSGATQQTLLQKADALFGASGYSLEVQTDRSLRAHVAVDSGVARVNPWGVPTTAGTWHHILLTWDGSSLALYLDGTEISRDDSQSGDIVHSDRPLFVGRGDNGYTTYYGMEGRLDDLRLYDRALSPEEVAAVAEGPPEEEELTTTEEPTPTTTTAEPTPTTTEEPTPTTTEAATPIPNDELGEAGYGAYGYGGLID